MILVSVSNYFKLHFIDVAVSVFYCNTPFRHQTPALNTDLSFQTTFMLGREGVVT